MFHYEACSSVETKQMDDIMVTLDFKGGKNKVWINSNVASSVISHAAVIGQNRDWDRDWSVLKVDDGGWTDVGHPSEWSIDFL